MVAATEILIPVTSAKHLVLEGVSWDFYERVLDEIGDGHTRVTFDEGSIEIMSPLPDHEFYKKPLARLIEMMCFERRVVSVGLGSTTFRDKTKLKGLEPDACYYFTNAVAARKITGPFDPSRHPAPDLAIEVDITGRSIPRQPIYAALGVPELWRVADHGIRCLILTERAKYEPHERSASLPFLKPSELWQWVVRLRSEEDITVLTEFRDWVRTLA